LVRHSTEDYPTQFRDPGTENFQVLTFLSLFCSRYPLLFQQLVKNVPPEDPNLKSYTSALEKLSNVASLVDKSSAKIASDQKLLSFDNLVGKLPVRIRHIPYIKRLLSSKTSIL